MKRLVLLALVGVLLLNAVPVQADDGFYVIPTRATPGTSITSLPYTINAPGYYYLTRNLTYTGSIAITVDADNVTLDLMGFTLTGPTNSSDSYGILIKESRNNVEVRNGTVRGWWYGVLTDPEGTSTGNGHRMIGVRAVGNAYGIFLGSNGTTHLIKRCTAVPGSFGSREGLVMRGSGITQGCTVMNFSNYGIYILAGGTISDNVVLNCTGTNAVGIWSGDNSTVSHNSVINCTTGIDNYGGNMIGNAVFATIGQTALKFNGYPVVADQNSFDLGSGATYYSGFWVGKWGVNGGATP